jgi:hypothetical protein
VTAESEAYRVLVGPEDRDPGPVARVDGPVGVAEIPVVGRGVGQVVGGDDVVGQEPAGCDLEEVDAGDVDVGPQSCLVVPGDSDRVDIPVDPGGNPAPSVAVTRAALPIRTFGYRTEPVLSGLYFPLWLSTVTLNVDAWVCEYWSCRPNVIGIPDFNCTSEEMSVHVNAPENG